MTRVMAFSDLHAGADLVPAVLTGTEGADLVIGTGDFCDLQQGLAQAMAMLAPLADRAVMVCGTAESAAELRAATAATVLHGTGTTQGGLALFGLGCAVPPTPFGDWSCDLTEDEAAALPTPREAAGILVTHPPPKGLADISSSGRSPGSTAIRAAVERARPRFCLCGHAHDGRGKRGRIGATEVLNLGPRPELLEV